MMYCSVFILALTNLIECLVTLMSIVLLLFAWGRTAAIGRTIDELASSTRRQIHEETRKRALVYRAGLQPDPSYAQDSTPPKFRQCELVCSKEHCR